MLALHLTHAIVFLLAAALAFGLGLQTPVPWAGAGFALLLATRTARSAVLALATRTKRGDSTLAFLRAWRPVAFTYFGAAGAFVVSVALRETWWSALGVAWSLGFGVAWAQLGRRNVRGTSAG